MAEPGSPHAPWSTYAMLGYARAILDYAMLYHTMQDYAVLNLAQI